MSKTIPLMLLLALMAGCAGMDDMSSGSTMMKKQNDVEKTGREPRFHQLNDDHI